MSNGIKITYLGERGSYSHQAAAQLFPDASLEGMRNFNDVVGAVESGDFDKAIIPIENSISGRIPDVHKLLLTMQLSIEAEYMLEIRHCFAVYGMRTIESPSLEIKTIYSHPQGFIQSRTFLHSHFPKADLIDMSDTASAARLISERKEPGTAAITSPVAAREYGCNVLYENISDVAENYTRFVVLGRDNIGDNVANADITTIIFQVNHTPGALIRALSVFEEGGINLLKLETYTISEKTARPTFYIDAGAGLNDKRMIEVLRRLETRVAYVKLLGSYPASAVRKRSSGFLPVDQPVGDK
ncbi:MAG: hypothetical protein JJ913_03640 [Rhizobiaceae bacterium]|nr:hypothetical protein [Rhizobiaceae bacterium]